MSSLSANSDSLGYSWVFDLHISFWINGICNKVVTKMISRRNLDIISGTIQIAVGVAVFTGSLSYDTGTLRTPGAGFFPRIASILMIGLSTIFTLQTLIARNSKASDPVSFFSERGAAQRILLCFVAMIGLSYLLPVIGFAPATCLFILFLSKCLGGYGWKVSIFYALVSMILAYYLFQVWLKVPMPSPVIRL